MRLIYDNIIDDLNASTLTALTTATGYSIIDVQDERLSTVWKSSSATTQSILVELPTFPEYPDSTAGTAYIGTNFATVDSWSGYGGTVSVSGGLLRFTKTGASQGLNRAITIPAGSTVRIKARYVVGSGTPSNYSMSLVNTTFSPTSILLPSDGSWKTSEAITSAGGSSIAFYLGTFIGTETYAIEFSIIYIGDGTYATKLPDVSGNGNDASVYGCTPVDGVAGKELSLDGINDGFSFANPLDTGAFSIELSLTTTVDGKHLCGPAGAAGNRQLFLYIGSINTAHKLNLRLYADGTTGIDFVSSESVDTGLRKHVVIVYTPSVSVQFYINGFLDTSITSNVPAALFKSTADFTVAKSANSFTGTLTPPRIYSRALSAAEVWDRYAELIPGAVRPAVLGKSVSGLGVVESLDGFGTPASEFWYTQAPGQDGRSFVTAKLGMRELKLQGRFPTPRDFGYDADTKKAILAVLNPKNGPGTLEYYFGDYGERHLVANDVLIDSVIFKNKPWEQPFQEFQLLFRALDPYLYDPAENGKGIAILSGTSFDATVLGQEQVFPDIRILGASANPALTNTTTGESFSLSYTLASGHYIDIVTRFGHRQVLLDGLTNLLGYLDIGSTFFALAQGSNVLALTGGGQAIILWRERYLGA